jgi:hypothetical protein
MVFSLVPRLWNRKQIRNYRPPVPQLRDLPSFGYNNTHESTRTQKKDGTLPSYPVGMYDEIGVTHNLLMYYHF